MSGSGDKPDINEITYETCENIKSRRFPQQKCKNPATHGKYCGIHHKHPVRWEPRFAPIVTRLKLQSAETIHKWFRIWLPFRKLRRHGIGFWDRTVHTNDTDFFSTDALKDIDASYFFSFRDTDNHMYGFDVRSIFTIVHRARINGEEALNPYNRSPITTPIKRRIMILIQWLEKRRLPTEWAPLQPPTPEQQWRMKVVDLFTKIDELNYYSSADWFINLNRQDQRKFYNEIHAIWTHRAGLTIQEKNTIVPHYLHSLFRHPPWALIDQPLESLQKINMNVIRMLITSAADKNDRILGAMYVVSALTLVCEQAKNAYPWLYESVFDEYTPHNTAPPITLGNYFGSGFWSNLISITARIPSNTHVAGTPPPPLTLPPPPPSVPLLRDISDSKDDDSDSDE